MALTSVGASGRSLITSGVTGAEGVLAAEFHPTFLATTVNVYDVPLVKPMTTIGLVVPVAVIFPGVDVTIYSKTGANGPLVEGVNSIVALVLPAVAVTSVGFDGTASLHSLWIVSFSPLFF